MPTDFEQTESSSRVFSLFSSMPIPLSLTVRYMPSPFFSQRISIVPLQSWEEVVFKSILHQRLQRKGWYHAVQVFRYINEHFEFISESCFFYFKVVPDVLYFI
jgi:hypothetical protein